MLALCTLVDFALHKICTVRSAGYVELSPLLMVHMPLSSPLRRPLSCCQQHGTLGPPAGTIASSPAQDDMKAGTEERWLLAASGGPFTCPSYIR